jgi:hypothetical protein
VIASTGPDADALAEEQHRLRRLRVVVDLTASVLAQGGLGRAEAEELVAATRRAVVALFPDKGGTFDLILAPRFARLMDEYVLPKPGNVLVFRARSAR